MCNFTWKCVNEAWEQTHLAVTWAGSAGLPACCTSCRCWEWRARGSWPRCPDLGTRSTSASPPPHDRSPSLYASTCQLSQTNPRDALGHKLGSSRPNKADNICVWRRRLTWRSEVARNSAGALHMSDQMVNRSVKCLESRHLTRPKSRLWNRVPEGSTLILEVLEFRSDIHVCSVWPSRYNTVQTDRPMQRHSTHVFRALHLFLIFACFVLF